MKKYQVPKFDSLKLRMPRGWLHARYVSWRFWLKDPLKHTYLYADVILENGMYIPGVEFNGKGVAVRFTVCCSEASECDEVFGQRVIEWCPIRSCSDGHMYDWAGDPERIRFAREQGKVVNLRGVAVPQRLLALIESGRWVHPGDEKMLEAIPFVPDPVDFLDLDRMELESAGVSHEGGIGVVYRAESKSEGPIPDLPWIDETRHIVIASCHEAGDDIVVALDFRNRGPEDPRVVASDWQGGNHEWRLVAPTFDEFLARIGID